MPAVKPGPQEDDAGTQARVRLSKAVGESIPVQLEADALNRSPSSLAFPFRSRSHRFRFPANSSSQLHRDGEGDDRSDRDREATPAFVEQRV
jgi:hypothetical protein